MSQKNQDLIISAIEKSFSSLHIQEAGGFPQFAVVTDGLTGQQAATIPGERLNSVWMVVNHLTLVQDGFNSAFRGELTEPAAAVTTQGESPFWPPLPEEINDANWQAARQGAINSNRRLAATIAALSDEQLKTPIPNLYGATPEQMIPVILAQNSYHTGEIITIRHMQGLWVDHPWA